MSKLSSLLLCGVVSATAVRSVEASPQAALPVHESEHDDRMAPDEPDLRSAWSPDWAEPAVPGTRPVQTAFAALTPSARQPQGALSGRIVFMNAGHGWTFDPAAWRLQRPSGLNEMNEDYGNLDQMNLFAAYCFNAGAVVVPMRPIGHQTSEVVLDNDDAGVVFSGAWSDSTSPIYWGSPGDVPYRFASLSAAETATATYTPAIPQTGRYPVYCWTRHGSDRGDQLYRIRHTGGETRLRIPHHMVGNGWVYLGEYQFNAGTDSAKGAVVISNLRSSATGSVVIADAVRFGIGMGSVDRGGGVSGYPHEEENMRYWVQSQLGQGQSVSLYEGSGNDEQDSWSAPPKMSAEMNRGPSQPPGGSDVLDYKRVHISFHSNAGGGRGTVGLITGTPTPNQAALAQLAGRAVTDELVALGSPPLEVPWFNKASVTYTGGYSEITGSLYDYEMDATIIEVAFHDNESDARLMRDPKARAAVAKAAMHAVVRYFNTYDTNQPAPLAFLPEAPTGLRATAANAKGQVELSWAAPASLGGSQPPTNYVVYRSSDGRGFGEPVDVGNAASFTVTNLLPGLDHYFRVAAVNAGGESMPSEVAGCRMAPTNGAPRVLVVNAFDRSDRSANLRQDLVRQKYVPPGANGANERVLPDRNNAFDYVVPHGRAIAAAGWAFDSCQNESVANGQVLLGDYAVVVWACGNESSADETFSSVEQSRIGTYLDAGGSLFVSGGEVAYDLGRPSGPTSADRAFLQNRLRSGYVADSSGSHTVLPAMGGLFAGRAGAAFDDGDSGIYRVAFPDVLSAVNGSAVALSYSGGSGGAAAVQYDGATGGGRLVVFGFPFETITDPLRREEYMADILAFLAPPPVRLELISVLPENQVRLVLSGEAGAAITLQSATNLPLWSTLTNLPNPSGTIIHTDMVAPGVLQKFYRATTP